MFNSVQIRRIQGPNDDDNTSIFKPFFWPFVILIYVLFYINLRLDCQFILKFFS